MKDTILIILTIPILFSCSAKKPTANNKNGNAIGIARPTFNPNTPYIYINGFSDYTIVKIPLIQNNDDTVFVNELKFNDTFSSFYSQEVMYEKFGKWTREIKPNIESPLILIWDNVKLLEDDNQLFTVYAIGEENMKEIYAAVFVFSQGQKDCLSEESIYKDKIIEYFSTGIQQVKENKKFYKLYLDTDKKFKSRK